MHSIPLARPLRCPEAELAIDPYLLGLWLGDGSCGAASITSHIERRTPLPEEGRGRGGELAHSRL